MRVSYSFHREGLPGKPAIGRWQHKLLACLSSLITIIGLTCPPRSTPVKKRVLPNSKGARRAICGKVCLLRLRSLGF